jgi:glucose-6-phosphate 1-dehydrogenase
MICDMLVIGGDGDLAYRKLYPALYHLHVAGCLPSCLKIVSVSRTQDQHDSFREKVLEKLSEYLEGEAIEAKQAQSFALRLFSYAVDATSETELRVLSRDVFTDAKRDLIVYLATPPGIFAPVCQSLWAVGLVRPNMRLVIEKPLGHDRASFLEINESLMGIFDEAQIYRIDHYLGKETVQNLLTLRFANALFEPLWNHTYIDHVQITAAETVGVGGRWSFYDKAGALRDMVQNHLLQLLCLLAMEPPASLDPHAVHDEKLKVLRSLAPLKGKRSLNTLSGLSTARARLAARLSLPTFRKRVQRAGQPLKPLLPSRRISITGAGPAFRSICAPGRGWLADTARSWCSSKNFRMRSSRIRLGLEMRTDW